ncbi:MAG TPA: DinB family protein [Chitinophagaceae bacterium]|nr:DinB family protein [Chitinophagaceae bacterium]
MQLSSAISTRLHYQHKVLVEILDGLSDEQIRRQLNPGKWSIFENVVHLQTFQHKFISRVKQILKNEEPVFDRYTAEGDPLFLDNCHKSTREIMQDLLTTRKEMTAEIVSFKETDFDKRGTHIVYGKMNLHQWLNFFLLHEAHHLFTIFKLAAELKQADRT